MTSVMEQIPPTDEIEGMARILNGNPYILVTVIGDGKVDLTFAGFEPLQVVDGLRQLAGQLAQSLAEEAYELPAADDDAERRVLMATHPAINGLLRWFEYEHLNERLQPVSRQFHALAHALADDIPPSAELTTSLRKLLEAKDAAVRAKIV